MSSETVLREQPAANATIVTMPETTSGATTDLLELSVRIMHRIEEVEGIWRALEAKGVESPGQSYDFIKLWIQTRRIDPASQFFVVAYHGGEPVALLPLHRKRVRGIRLFTWFPGANVGAYAPLMDMARVTAMSAGQRQSLWTAMTGALPSADLVYLRAVPTEIGGVAGLFDMGTSLAFETVYRSHYGNWADCDKLQRSKSRRKHDRQQGDRLEAMGAVSFAEVRGGAEAGAIVDAMFKQRSARFKAMGIPDTFVREGLVGFYQAAAQAGSGIDVRLHVLHLNGDLVAVRYNVVQGDTMYCLISSMSEDPAIQNGSPGKQCLLRVMQSVFDNGIATFDMGAGFTDEKRHWCNVQMPLEQHYVPLSPVGEVVLAVHRLVQRAKVWIKANKRIMQVLRMPGQWLNRLAGAKPKGASE